MRYALTTLMVGAAAIWFPAAAQAPLDAHCSQAATQATGYTPGAASGPDGDRARAATRGAAGGAAVGAAQNSQYDNAPQGLKDAHREDQAKKGAAAGVAVAGSRNRQERRQGRRAEDDWQKSYDACMAQKPQ